MNNYQNPYYGGMNQMPAYGGYQYANPYQTGMQNNIQPQAQPQVQQTQTSSRANCDFQGNYVKSYEEAKNSPYTDKTMVYLDTENDKMYIKRINEKGIPETSVYLVTAPTENIKEEKEENKIQENVMQNIMNFKKEYDDKINELQKQIRELKSVKGGK